jgi:lysine 6-dehydrogenase
MGHHYTVLGAGRQGTAAAYDFARNGDADEVALGDASSDRAQAAALRVNSLLRKQAVRAVQVDARDPQAVTRFLAGANVAVSAVPYHLNLGVARAAIAARASLCDLGGNTEIVFAELALDAEAKRAGISLVPDCGMVPGLGTSVCMAAMEMVEQPRDVYLWDGGLPQTPQAPWNYILTFHFEGLVNEYFGTTEFLRDGRITEVPCFEEYELVDFPAPIGQLEAFTTAGGTSSAPRTFLGRLRTYQNKTLRYPGHYQQWKTLRDAGLFEVQPVHVPGGTVRPRDLLASALEPRIRAKPGEKDVCIIRARAEGQTGGKSAAAVVDLYDYYDDATGFTAMERTTGWHAAMLAIRMARGQVAKGAVPVERAVSGADILEECRARGMRIATRTE